MQFSSPILPGLGLGKKIGFPTLNFDVACAPKNLEEGIYSVEVKLEKKSFHGVMHYGPRPAIGDRKKSLEVHVIDELFSHAPFTATIIVNKRIRAIRACKSLPQLAKLIAGDIREAKKIIAAGS